MVDKFESPKLVIYIAPPDPYYSFSKVENAKFDSNYTPLIMVKLLFSKYRAPPLSALQLTKVLYLIKFGKTLYPFSK